MSEAQPVQIRDVAPVVALALASAAPVDAQQTLRAGEVTFERRAYRSSKPSTGSANVRLGHTARRQ
jgi:hypothetical protein